MFIALYYIFWTEFHEFRNSVRSRAIQYGVRMLVGFPVLLLGAWMFANLFSSVTQVAAQGDQAITRNLGHAFCVIVGISWIVLALQFDLNSLKYNHIKKLFHFPWSFRQLYSACLLRAICDIWILFWTYLILWWVLGSEPGFTVLGWAMVVVSIMLFGLSIVSWTHVLRTAIERSVHSYIYKWAVRLVLVGLFVGANYGSIVSNFESSDSENIDVLVSDLNVADYTVATPPGLLAEIIHALRVGDASSAGLCVAGLMAFVLTGWHFGIGMTRKTMQETGSTGWMTASKGNGKSLFEWISDRLAGLVSIGYVLFMTQEIVYLLRWNRVRVTVAFFFILIPGYLISVAPRAPQLLGICPWYYCMIKFMFSYLNKDGKAVWHNYLLPFDNYKVIVGKNAALLLLQYLISLICSAIILPFIWNSFNWAEVLSLLLLSLFLPLFLMALGNLVSISNPLLISRPYTSLTTPLTTSTGTAAMALALAFLLIGASSTYVIFNLVMKSEFLLVMAFSFFGMASFLLFVWSIWYAARLLETNKDKILNTYSGR